MSSKTNKKWVKKLERPRLETQTNPSKIE